MDETDEMVRLLLSGVKMLGVHCPRCSLPLFDKGGAVLCVRCGRVRVVREDRDIDSDSEAGSGGSKVDSDSDVSIAVFERKKADLLKRLESESDPSVIASLSEAIGKLEQVLRNLRN